MGYIQQAFTKGCVKERLRHGVENIPFLQRDDYKRLVQGKTQKKYDRKDTGQSDGDGAPAPPRNLKDIMAEQMAAEP